MPVFYSPNGNPEIWETMPKGYCTLEEWEAKQPLEPIDHEQELAMAKKAKLQQIVEDTTTALQSGFFYTINGQKLLFAYDRDAQQDFADTANMVNFDRNGVPGIPQSTIWSGWELVLNEDGQEISRTLVELVLSSEDFLGLYQQGAMVHKLRQKAIERNRKTLVEEVETIEELEGI